MSGFAGVLIAISCLLFGNLPVVAQGQSLKFNVLVLDALDGKPEANVEIGYFCEGKGWNPQTSVKTGLNGKAEVPYPCEGGTRIEIRLQVPGGKKEECGGVGPLDISYVLSHGFLSPPNGAGGLWCPTRQSRKLSAVPGQITVFIKKPTWWQSHVAG
ncbi:MAG TPA: hypothetical protein VGN16_13550 [Acidobacteriaceae bacterium]|jgi:hypothetical protein